MGEGVKLWGFLKVITIQNEELRAYLFLHLVTRCILSEASTQRLKFTVTALDKEGHRHDLLRLLRRCD